MTKNDTPENSSSSDQETPTQQQAEPTSPPKNQLTRRVVARIAELEAAQEQLGDAPATQKRRDAIVAALKAARDSMNLGGERMSASEATLIARWLQSTQYLISLTS